ncbi:MAG TPA: phospho-sugar mutase [Polyangiales bacterium]|nr:phospho-sugar mutase [Polyangiales bacterium]
MHRGAAEQELIAAARASRDDDPDPLTRAETDALLQRVALDELAERFGSEIAFGTAGLRGLIGAGTSRMNRRAVARTTAGLCAYLVRSVPDAQRRGVCIGFDARHGSRDFADEAASVARGAGFEVHMFDGVVPTPLLAFAVLDRAACAGIMITASHNPAEYNGYKVYLSDGAQLSSPHDREIQREIAGVVSVLQLPRVATGRRSLSDAAERYVSAIAGQVQRPACPLPLRVAYTALHGVGELLARRVFERIGALDVHSVAEQATPDPDFPTVRFPNPEEKGALDRLLELGERVRADLALANDPDADRLALCARDAGGKLAALSGNELGVLLADHLLSRAPHDGKNLIVTTIVSTPLVERVAQAHGARCERTLTGFKWIVPRALELERSEGLRFVLGFEEAIGYCVGPHVRDKDGIGAAAHALHMAELQARAGRTLHAALEVLYRRHGFCQSSQVSFTQPGPDGVAELAAALARVRAKPPLSLGGIRVAHVRDLLHGTGTAAAGGGGQAALPSSDVLVLELEGGHRITLRPSGTEPKLKIYLDLWAQLEASTPLVEARARAGALAAQLVAALVHALGLN